MATALTLPWVSPEDYLSSAWRPDMEYIDGTLVERHVGTILHSRLQRILLVYLDAFRKSRNVEALPECRTMVSSVRYRIPDVMLVSSPAPAGRVYTSVPLAVIEILSPDDRLQESMQRFHDYAELGVPHIIQMDPEDRVTRVYRNGDLIATGLTSLALPDGGSIDFNSSQLLG